MKKSDLKKIIKESIVEFLKENSDAEIYAEIERISSIMKSLEMNDRMFTGGDPISVSDRKRWEELKTQRSNLYSQLSTYKSPEEKRAEDDANKQSQVTAFIDKYFTEFDRRKISPAGSVKDTGSMIKTLQQSGMASIRNKMNPSSIEYKLFNLGSFLYRRKQIDSSALMEFYKKAREMFEG
jgi:hypothetical protein